MATVDSIISPLELASLRPLAEQGDAEAQLELAEYYKGKFGNPFPDVAKAAIWYLKSARQGNAVAQNALGLMYDLGEGLPQNSFEAVRWYRLAANNDHAPAMFALAKKYGAGDGVQRDDVQAHLWVTLAIARFEKLQSDLADKEKRVIVKNAIAYHNDLSSRLTPEDLSKAQRLARELRSNQIVTAIDEENSDETPNVSVPRERQPHETITAVDGEKSKETPDVSVTPEWRPHETIAAVDEENSNEKPDVLVAPEWQPHQTITAVDEENSNETLDVSVPKVIDAFIDRTSPTPQQLSVDRGNRVVNNNGRTGWFYLIGSVPIIGLIIFGIFFVFSSELSNNIFGLFQLTSEDQPMDTTDVPWERVLQLMGEIENEPVELATAPAPVIEDVPAETPEVATLTTAAPIENASVETDQASAPTLADAQAAYDRADFSTAATQFQFLANQGDVGALYNLGVMYANGQGVQQDEAEAVGFYRMAAAQEHVAAQYELGQMYANGQGVGQNIADAMRWYRLAAEQGHEAAQSVLAEAAALTLEDLPNEFANASEPTLEEPLDELAEASALTLENPPNELGVASAPTLEDPPDELIEASAPTLEDALAAYERSDYLAAVSIFQLLANQGDARAQHNLAVMYGDGLSVPQDDVESMRWYRMAADQGVARAQYELGRMYENGRGVQQDEAEAMRWYRLAAEQEFAPAQARINAP